MTHTAVQPHCNSRCESRAKDNELAMFTNAATAVFDMWFVLSIEEHWSVIVKSCRGKGRGWTRKK